MTQANDTVRKGIVFNVFISIMLILSIGIGFMSLTADKEVPVVNVDLGDIEARLNAIELNQVDTAAGEVTIDTTALEITVAKMDGFKNILDDLMNAAYGTEKDYLEIEGNDTFNDIFDDDGDFEDFLEDFEDFLEIELVGFDTLVVCDYDDEFFLNGYEDDLGTDGVKYTIINLGIDDEEDRQILVEKEYKIKYELDDSDTVYKDYVLVSGMVSYDEDDEELKADMTFTLV